MRNGGSPRPWPMTSRSALCPKVRDKTARNRSISRPASSADPSVLARSTCDTMAKASLRRRLPRGDPYLRLRYRRFFRIAHPGLDKELPVWGQNAVQNNPELP